MSENDVVDSKEERLNQAKMIIKAAIGAVEGLGFILTPLGDQHDLPMRSCDWWDVEGLWPEAIVFHDRTPSSIPFSKPTTSDPLTSPGETIKPDWDQVVRCCKALSCACNGAMSLVVSGSNKDTA